ncbi:flavodoxin fold protein [Salix suchowensis]|nr:flavodoxin fold protein [Salix suchowensis]
MVDRLTFDPGAGVRKLYYSVAIIVYSMYGHVAKCAVPETLSDEILTKMHAPAKPDYPIITPAKLTEFDAFIFGIPTRYGNFPAQWKSFWDATGSLWATGALAGKYAGLFVSTGTQGGGQESTNHLRPLGYATTFKQLANLDEVHGGSPWGAGTFAAGNGSRQPSALELEIAELQGKMFWSTVRKVKF